MAKEKKSQADSKPSKADAAMENEEGHNPESDSENKADAVQAVSKYENMSTNLKLRKERMGH